MARLEPSADLARETNGLRHGEAAPALNPLLQRLALDEGDDVVDEILNSARIVRRQKCRVIPRGKPADLQQEPFGTLRAKPGWVEQLDDDAGAVGLVP